MSNTHYSKTVNLSTPERWLSLAGGGALIAAALTRKSGLVKTAGALLGAELARRGATGHCYMYEAFGYTGAPRESRGAKEVLPYELGVIVRVATTIHKPRETLYRFWRNFENLPRIMSHLVSVEERDDRISYWIAQGPAGTRVRWHAEVYNELPNELIAWRSLPGSQVDSAGSVQFKDAPGGRGTEVIVHLQYNPPLGFVGAQVAKLFGRDAATEIEADLFRLKQLMETGEVATIEGQPQGPSRPEPRRETRIEGDLRRLQEATL
jgi:uncharacterized membrane protein